MSTEKDNVVSFKPKAETPQQEAGVPTNPIEFFTQALGLSEVTQEKLKEAEQLTRDMQVVIADAMEKFGKDHGEKMDITVPLLALSTVFTLFARDMDEMIPEEELQNHNPDSHTNFRIKLAETINNTIGTFVDQHPDVKVLAHDLYIPIATALSSHLIQHRMHHFFKAYENQQPSVEPTDGDKHNI